ncbi:uncharacterized protein LOC114566923 [Perca flavescens]|uniref:uncharacterized protein LOC114566923 n=1 Tax=Perca flavescens TaxID=8167 RepID=UPI00106E0512|nr:uncharacterized protein LOC114566923 [Perca flavescens]
MPGGTARSLGTPAMVADGICHCDRLARCQAGRVSPLTWVSDSSLTARGELPPGIDLDTQTPCYLLVGVHFPIRAAWSEPLSIPLSQSGNQEGKAGVLEKEGTSGDPGRTAETMPGSTKKSCISCHAMIGVARKKCNLCGREQPYKAIKMNKLKKIEEKPPTKFNAVKALDSAFIDLHKLKAVGFYPLLLVAKQGKKKFKAQLLHLEEQPSRETMKAFATIKGVFETFLNWAETAIYAVASLPFMWQKVEVIVDKCGEYCVNKEEENK